MGYHKPLPMQWRRNIVLRFTLCLLLWLNITDASHLQTLVAKPDPQIVGLESSITREKAVQFALAHNPNLGAAQERIAASKGNLQSAKAFPPAEVNIGPSFGGDLGPVPLLTQTLEISGKRAGHPVGSGRALSVLRPAA